MNDHITTDLRFSMVPAWLLDRSISDKALRLYAVLAGYADSETGQAYPGRTLLSRRMDCSVKTVDRAVQELLEIGAIKKQQRVKDGHYQSSLYTVVRVDPTPGVTRPRVKDDATPCHTRRDPVSPVTHRTITTEPEPFELEPLNDIVQAFNDFWNIYPRKQGKGKAKEAFIKASKLEDVELILQGAERYATDRNLPDPKFIPLPATWLNQERWDDGPLPLNRELTNSERNILSLRASMALLENEPMKEVESGQVTGEGIADFGINLRSAKDI